ncbi:MAG: dienelactone hydrolase family protein [Enhygromyxa sp.]
MPDIQLQARDGHQLSAHRLDPLGDPRGAVVVIQEIFGVNAHIRATAARYCAAGYATIAPAFFDRIAPKIELGYTQADLDRGRELVGQLTPEQVLADLQAAIDALRDRGPVGIVGYCWGGSVVWIAAHQAEGIAKAVSYYGSRIVDHMDEEPKVPLQMHVGERDASFPIDKVHELGQRYPDIEIHEYDAGHGFNCDHRDSFDSLAAAHALQRSLAFFEGG